MDRVNKTIKKNRQNDEEDDDDYAYFRWKVGTFYPVLV
jgi:hypothetical protein